MGNINESSMDALFNGLTSTPKTSEEHEPETEPQEQTQHTEEEDPMPQTRQVQQSSNAQKRLKQSRKQLKEGFLVRLEKENLDKTRTIAFQNGLAICDVIDYALSDFIERYEKKNGRIKTKGRKVNVSELL